MESINDPIRLRIEGDVAIITLHNPDSRNAFSVPMREAMAACLYDLDGREDCRAVVLTGADGNFCAGGDIREMQRRSTLKGRARMELPTRIFKTLVSGRLPVVAAVEGHAAGAGVSLIAASDYAVASTAARFSCGFITLGLIPDVGGLWSLSHKLGLRRTFELCALADSFDAQEALRIGLLNRVCAAGDALGEALRVAHRLARQPPLAMALLKNALAIGSDTLDQAIGSEITHQATLMASDDYAKAIEMFRQRRRMRRGEDRPPDGESLPKSSFPAD